MGKAGEGRPPKWLSKALSVAFSITIFVGFGVYMKHHLEGRSLISGCKQACKCVLTGLASRLALLTRPLMCYGTSATPRKLGCHLLRWLCRHKQQVGKASVHRLQVGGDHGQRRCWPCHRRVRPPSCLPGAGAAESQLIQWFRCLVRYSLSPASAPSFLPSWCSCC